MIFKKFFKNSFKLGIERNFLNLIKGIYEKPTTNFILNGERLNAFSLRSRTGQRYSKLPLLFNIIWKS